MNEYDQMYLDEMSRMTVLGKEETAELLKKLPDKGAQECLVNGNLGYVAEIAREYASERIDILDLIQEGSMALMLLVKYYKEGDFEAMRERAVRTAMKAWCEGQSENEQIKEKMAGYINVLNKVTTVMAQELGREATIEEIAQKMQMSEDEIRVLMKEAVNAVNIEK